MRRAGRTRESVGRRETEPSPGRLPCHRRRCARPAPCHGSRCRRRRRLAGLSGYVCAIDFNPRRAAVSPQPFNRLEHRSRRRPPAPRRTRSATLSNVACSRADRVAASQLDAEPQDLLDLAHRGPRRGAARACWSASRSRPPGLGCSSKSVQACPAWRKLVRGGQSGRSGADDRPRVCRSAVGTRAGTDRLTPGPVGHEPFQLADGHRAVRRAAAAAFFARLGANAAQHGRQGDVLLDRGDRLVQLRDRRSAAASAGCPCGPGRRRSRAPGNRPRGR